MRGGSGYISSRYSIIANDSVRHAPSSSSSIGSLPNGLRAKCSGCRCSPFGILRLTCSIGISLPLAAFSARYKRTLVGLGATWNIYNFITALSLPLDYTNVCPPSMVKVIPVTYPFFMRNSTASATSSAVPIRLTGKRAAAAARISPFFAPNNESSNGVSTYPGSIVLTRIGARSSASARANASTAPHDADATAAPSSGRHAATPDINVIDPPVAILGAAYFAAYSAPQNRVSIAGRKVSLSGASFLSAINVPAVMKTWSTRARPWKKRRVPSSSATSRTTVRASAPSSACAR